MNKLSQQANCIIRAFFNTAVQDLSTITSCHVSTLHCCSKTNFLANKDNVQNIDSFKFYG